MTLKTDNRQLVIPVLYKPEYEQMEANEVADTEAITAALQEISDITSKDYGKAMRSVHAKSHGLLRGTLQVNGNLPEIYRQGIFSESQKYSAIIRFSTTPGDILDDNVSTPRGVAIKLFDITGDFISAEPSAQTQDFLLVNGSAFLSPDIKGFAKSLKLLAKTTDKAEGLKKLLSTALQGTEKAIESLGGKSPTIISLGGHPETHLLGETYYSQVPILYGKYMAKVALKPLSPSLVALKDQPVDLKDKPNGLREAVSDYFKAQSALWALQIQLCTDIEKMPIEDSTIVWSEEESPYVTVAILMVDPQVSWYEIYSPNLEDVLSFNPWHAVKAHRPLGSIMRARKVAYEKSSTFRHEFNGCPIQEINQMKNYDEKAKS